MALAQVTASAAGTTSKVLLEPRFQHAIDRAAAVAGLTDTQSYVGEWRREPHALEGDPAVAADEVANQIHTDYDRQRLEALVQAGGLSG